MRSAQIKRGPSLQRWYASEFAKRAFGNLCSAVDEQKIAVLVGGTQLEPLLVLSAADMVPPCKGEIILTIEVAKADWSSVTLACSIYGTQFRIRGIKAMRAVLTRHPTHRHPAERYFRSSSPDAEDIATELMRLAFRVRKFDKELDQP
jgi:hypothetical protein